MFVNVYDDVRVRERGRRADSIPESVIEPVPSTRVLKAILRCRSESQIRFAPECCDCDVKDDLGSGNSLGRAVPRGFVRGPDG